MIEVLLNGKPREVNEGETLAGLLKALDLDPRWVVAEVNGEVVDRHRFGEVSLSGGDRLELVRAVAGG